MKVFLSASAASLAPIASSWRTRFARSREAELLMCRALAIDQQAYGPDHPDVARVLNNLAQLLQATSRLAEAEPLMRSGLQILAGFAQQTGYQHPNHAGVADNYTQLLRGMGLEEAEIEATCARFLKTTAPPTKQIMNLGTEG